MEDVYLNVSFKVRISTKTSLYLKNYYAQIHTDLITYKILGMFRMTFNKVSTAWWRKINKRGISVFLSRFSRVFYIHILRKRKRSTCKIKRSFVYSNFNILVLGLGTVKAYGNENRWIHIRQEFNAWIIDRDIFTELLKFL